MSVAEIARRMGIRYQHAYNVLKASKQKSDQKRPSLSSLAKLKPSLTVKELTRAGFQESALWILSKEGELEIDGDLPREAGVYAFVRKGLAVYVGVATMGLAKRIYFYRKPGSTQRTSKRLNGILKGELVEIPSISIFTACPADLEWKGLPVHGSAGLELGLIKKFALPWNMRSAG